MKHELSITTLFTDIGGVLLTNGWDHKTRKVAADIFNLNLEELEERHHLTFDTYEEGKLTLDEYLERIIFYEERAFSLEQFREFMFNQSKPFPEMIKMVCQLKEKYGIKIAAISNEGRELTEYRIHTYKLNDFIDFFVSSCFVHFRKPDADIFRIALDIAQVETEKVVFLDDRLMFVQVALDLGINGIRHTDYQTTREKLALFGLET